MYVQEGADSVPDGVTVAAQSRADFTGHAEPTGSQGRLPKELVEPRRRCRKGDEHP